MQRFVRVFVLIFLAVGMYFTLVTRGFQIFHLPLWMKKTLGSIFQKRAKPRPGAMSRWQALCTSLAATIGTGNIAGVATAIVAGGPGALFWMWVSAFVGMMTAYAEKLLGHVYRYRKEDGSYMGGAMVTIERGMGSRKLGVIYALLLLVTSLGMGNMIQANSIAQAAEATWGISPLILAPALALLVLLCTHGGGQKIGKVTEFLVPFMSLLYMGGALVVLWIFRENLGGAIRLVMEDAFSFRAMSIGIARGVFSNEAGLGSAVIAHAQSDVEEPVEQGMWGILEVFLDTTVMCTITGLVLLVTGVCGSGYDGAVLTIEAFSSVFGSWGESVISVSIFLFALSTLIAWSFFGSQCMSYIWGDNGRGLYMTVFYVFIFLGCFGHLQTVWHFSDLCNNLLAVPNILCLLVLRKQVSRLTKAYLNDKPKRKHKNQPEG